MISLNNSSPLSWRISTMFVSTTFPSFPVRSYARTPFARAALVRSALRSATPAVSGSWVENGYALTVDLPGVPENAIGVAVAGRTLSIDVATDSLTWNERIRLPQTLDAEQVTAQYVNGRLTVTIAKSAEAAPRAIAIDTAPAPAELAQPAEVASEPVETSVTE
jgi:HSP20 family protein